MLKIITEELGFGKAVRAERSMATHIPYLRHVSDTVIGLQNGAVLSVIKLDGLLFQTIDQAELNMRTIVQNTLLRSLGTSRFSVWSTIIRREVEIALEGRFDDPFCAHLNKRYMAQLRRKRMFVNEISLTIVRSDMRGILNLGDRVKHFLNRSGDHQARREQTQEDVTAFEDLMRNMTRSLKKYGARVLGVLERDDGVYSEPCEFFNTILTGGVSRKMRLPRMGICNYIGTSRLHFGKRTMQTQAAVETDNRYGAVLSIKEYPSYTAPGMLDGLLQSQHEFILTQSFTICDKPVAIERINRLQRQISASDEAGTQVETDLDFTLNGVMNQDIVVGYHHLTLLCLARDLDGVGRSVADLGACLTDVNINWLREDLNLEAAFWAQLPGNHGYIARQAMLSSANFSGLSSMHNFALGQSEGMHWGLPITLLETVSQTPYCFNFHQRDIGHFLVTGPTGSGKTVALSFLFAQAFRIAAPLRAVFFDKDQGAEVFIRAMGGNYELLTPGHPTGFNPLQLENTNSNRAFLLRLLKAMFRSTIRKDFTQADEEIMERAIARLMQEPVSERRLSNLAGLLVGHSRAEANDLHSCLKPWINGEKAWVFNAEQDTLSFSEQRIFGFDMTRILGHEDLRIPVLMYLFHRFEELLTGDPVMFFMDEGWQFLSDENFSHFIIDKLKTIRKLNGIFGFGTQSVADIAQSEASHTIIEQAATHIHFPNPRADEACFVQKFGLSAKEFNFIKRTAPEKRAFLIKTGTDSVIARLDLSAMPDLVKVLSGRKETIKECATLRKKYGEDPKDWLPKFCGWKSKEKASVGNS